MLRLGWMVLLSIAIIVLGVVIGSPAAWGVGIALLVADLAIIGYGLLAVRRSRTSR